MNILGPGKSNSMPEMSAKDNTILELERLATLARSQSLLYTKEIKAGLIGLAQGYEESIKILKKYHELEKENQDNQLTLIASLLNLPAL